MIRLKFDVRYKVDIRSKSKLKKEKRKKKKKKKKRITMALYDLTAVSRR